MTRLRRSLRGTAPTKLSIEERFEKIISYVRTGAYSENLREFNMPSYILTDFHANNSPTTKSTLEALPTDILLSIVEKFTGNEQIMAALVCKTLAAVVETSTVRKIANICDYWLGRKDPAMKLAYGSELNDDVLSKWHECGYDGPKARHHYYYWRVATTNQYSSLKESVGGWLGPKYKYCFACHKFRLDDKKFWKLFAEYENPEILQKSTLKETKKNAKKIAHENDAAEKVEQAINYWCGAMELNGFTISGSLQDRSCPAHMMLEERRNGERVLKRWTHEA